jgi:DNA mismatch repair protein MutS
MGGLLDLERLLGRLALDSAGPREMIALAKSLSCLPHVQHEAMQFKSQLWKYLSLHRSISVQVPGALATGLHGLSAELSTPQSEAGFDTLDDLCGLIFSTLIEEPSTNVADGGFIRSGVHTELDELRVLSNSGRQALAAIEERERQRTGIGSLKVRFNSVFGYYLEVTKANSRSVPADYERKQTLVNAERFTTPELKEYEAKILTAQERSLEIERQIFAELRLRLLEAAGRIRETARRVALTSQRCADGPGRKSKTRAFWNLSRHGIRSWNSG